MKSLPPGPVFLAKSLPYLLAPAAATLGALRLADKYLGLTVSPWTAALLALLARPVLFVFQRYYSRWADARAAAGMGASILPHVEEQGLGLAGTTIIKRMLHDAAQGYPGILSQRHFSNITWLSTFFRRLFPGVVAEIWEHLSDEASFRQPGKLSPEPACAVLS